MKSLVAKWLLIVAIPVFLLNSACEKKEAAANEECPCGQDADGNCVPCPE